MKPIYFFYIYLLLINIAAIAITCLDKRRAQKGKWRIKESTLLIIAALGGSFFMYLTMHIIRHKTQKKKFMLGIPLIFIIQLIGIIVLVYKYGI